MQIGLLRPVPNEKAVLIAQPFSLHNYFLAAFLADAFFTGFLALAAGFLAAGFLAAGFLAAGFFAAGFLGLGGAASAAGASAAGTGSTWGVGASSVR